MRFSPGDYPKKLGWGNRPPPSDCCCTRATNSGVHVPGANGVPGLEGVARGACTVSGWVVPRSPLFAHVKDGTQED